jgi:hypothetical protein
MVVGVKEQWSRTLKGPENENWMKRDPARKKEPLDFLSPLFDVSRQHHTGLYNSRGALLFLLLVLLFFAVYSSVIPFCPCVLPLSLSCSRPRAVFNCTSASGASSHTPIVTTRGCLRRFRKQANSRAC